MKKTLLFTAMLAQAACAVTGDAEQPLPPHYEQVKSLWQQYMTRNWRHQAELGLEELNRGFDQLGAEAVVPVLNQLIREDAHGFSAHRVSFHIIQIDGHNPVSPGNKESLALMGGYIKERADRDRFSPDGLPQLYLIQKGGRDELEP